RTTAEAGLVIPRCASVTRAFRFSPSPRRRGCSSPPTGTASSPRRSPRQPVRSTPSTAGLRCVTTVPSARCSSTSCARVLWFRSPPDLHDQDVLLDLVGYLVVLLVARAPPRTPSEPAVLLVPLGGEARAVGEAHLRLPAEVGARLSALADP